MHLVLNPFESETIPVILPAESQIFHNPGNPAVTYDVPPVIIFGEKDLSYKQANLTQPNRETLGILPVPSVAVSELLRRIGPAYKEYELLTRRVLLHGEVQNEAIQSH